MFSNPIVVIVFDTAFFDGLPSLPNLETQPLNG